MDGLVGRSTERYTPLREGSILLRIIMVFKTHGVLKCLWADVENTSNRELRRRQRQEEIGSAWEGHINTVDKDRRVEKERGREREREREGGGEKEREKKEEEEE